MLRIAVNALASMITLAFRLNYYAVVASNIGGWRC